jgi:hypothetical protein
MDWVSNCSVWSGGSIQTSVFLARTVQIRIDFAGVPFTNFLAFNKLEYGIRHQAVCSWRVIHELVMSCPQKISFCDYFKKPKSWITVP